MVFTASFRGVWSSIILLGWFIIFIGKGLRLSITIGLNETAGISTGSYGNSTPSSSSSSSFTRL